MSHITLPHSTPKRIGRRVGRKSLASMNPEEKASNHCFKSYFNQNTLSISYFFLDCSLKKQDIRGLKAYSNSYSPNQFTDEESNPEGLQIVQVPEREPESPDSCSL